MKKFAYFIPAVLLAALDAAILFLGSDLIPLQHLLWLALFIISGTLLVRRRFWGAAFGLLPAVEFMHMSTIHTGQVINIEMPLGIVLFVYYIFCAVLAYRKGKV